MPKQRAAGKCGSANCCDNRVCRCGGVAWGSLYITFANVAMNFAPPACVAGCKASAVDQTWFNGVTYLFNPEWDIPRAVANNPNAFDGIEFSTTQCSSQAGRWVYTYSTSPLRTFEWGIGVSFGGPFSGEFLVSMILYCLRTNQSPDIRSSQYVQYAYPSGCPTGSYYEKSRSFPTNENNYAFDFRNFTASLLWVV